MPIERAAFAVFVAAALAACAGQSTFAPAGNVTAARSAGVRRAAPSAENVIRNPGFEDGLAGWNECAKLGVSLVTFAHSGKKSVLLGTTRKPEIDGLAGICQTVTVPTEARLTVVMRCRPEPRRSGSVADQCPS